MLIPLLMTAISSAAPVIPGWTDEIIILGPDDTAMGTPFSTGVEDPSIVYDATHDQFIMATIAREGPYVASWWGPEHCIPDGTGAGMHYSLMIYRSADPASGWQRTDVLTPLLDWTPTATPKPSDIVSCGVDNVDLSFTSTGDLQLIMTGLQRDDLGYVPAWGAELHSAILRAEIELDSTTGEPVLQPGTLRYIKSPTVIADISQEIKSLVTATEPTQTIVYFEQNGSIYESHESGGVWSLPTLTLSTDSTFWRVDGIYSPDVSCLSGGGHELLLGGYTLSSGVQTDGGWSRASFDGTAWIWEPVQTWDWDPTWDFGRFSSLKISDSDRIVFYDVTVGLETFIAFRSTLSTFDHSLISNRECL